jgi:hypothetical protein
MQKYLFLSSIFLISLVAPVVSFGTTCYTDCQSRFPKWYQGPDRARCNVEKNVACLEPSGLPAPTTYPDMEKRGEELTRRLLSEFLENGYVVSRDRQNKPMHQGDSLIWSGIAMASLSCEDAAPIRKALVDSVLRHDGRFLRIDPLPASYKGNETSRDAETGALFGFTMHALRCPQFRPQLAHAWQKHREFVERHGLHEGWNPNFFLNPSMKFIFDLVSHELLGTARPSDESRKLFEAGVLLDSKTIAYRKSACYPIHLSTLMLVLAAKLGKPVNELTRREFCHDTRGMDLPLTEWYCGRGNFGNYLASFETDKWEYRHQRCPRWESPDVDPGDRSPGVDFLVALRIAN